jgi:hypothetical protein
VLVYKKGKMASANYFQFESAIWKFSRVGRVLTQMLERISPKKLERFHQ